MINATRGLLKTCEVKAPGFGDRRKAMLEDIAIVTGATVVAEETGRELDNTTLDILGYARRIAIDKDNTTLIGSEGESRAVATRVALFREQCQHRHR